MPVCIVNYYRNKNDSDSEHITKEQSDRDDRYFYSPEDLDFFNDGYLFREWNTKRNGTGASYTPEDVVGDDYTLYAIWEALPRYRISSDTLTSLANTIRSEAGISGTLSYPDGFISAINTINGGNYIDRIVDPRYIELLNDENGFVKNIRSGAFGECTTLYNVSFPECITIGDYAFYNCSNLTSISFPKCTIIGNDAFLSCSKLTSVSFPECTTIGSSAFNWCTGLSNIFFPKCEMIGSYAFIKCSNLTTINIPECSSIGNAAFCQCSKLISFSFAFSKFTIIEDEVFGSCYSISNVSFPECTIIGNYAFQKCSNLTSVSFPKCTTIGYSAFYMCYELTDTYFLECTSIGSYAFGYCSNLSILSIPNCSYIGSYAFINCCNLLYLYLLSSAFVSIPHASIFNGTPISNNTASTGGVYGSIYVPQSMLESYKTSTNWAQYSSRFVGVEV